MNDKQLNELVVALMNVEDTIYDNPDRLSKGLIALSAHIYTIGNTIIEAERKYAEKWDLERGKYKSDKGCDNYMKMTEEYKELKQRENSQKMTLEIIRSVKKRLAVLSDELKSIY